MYTQVRPLGKSLQIVCPFSVLKLASSALEEPNNVSFTTRNQKIVSFF